MGWTARIRFPTGAGIFPFRPYLQTGSDTPHIKRIPGSLSPEVERQECETDHSLQFAAFTAVMFHDEVFWIVTP
jgi:hypothetical protein